MRPLLLTLVLCLAACGGGDEADASLTGTYVLDAKAFAAEALQRRQDEGAARLSDDADQRRVLEATWRQAARDEARRTAVELTLRKGGRFVSRYRFGGEQGSSSGTWRRVDDRLVLTTEAEKGRRLQKPYESTARISDGTLRMQGVRVPIAFSLRRRP